MTARSALASVATAAFALSKLFQTSTAMKPTNSAKRMPRGGNMPGETALKARAHSVSVSLVTIKYTPPAIRYVATKTIKAIHKAERLSNQSATIDFSCLTAGCGSILHGQLPLTTEVTLATGRETPEFFP